MHQTIQKQWQPLNDFTSAADSARQRALGRIIGRSSQIKEVGRLIERAAATDRPILIQGENGTGKELVARALQMLSHRSADPFVVINCAALPETLLESELFGHEKGAFTGATGQKQGLLEVANGGTLFIDEIGELALGLQAKLLRVLEDGMFRRVGSVDERHIDVRLLAATNRDLGEAVQQRLFREDLLYRINVLTIHLPPLRQRVGDVAVLVRHFTDPDWSVDPDVMPILERYGWPGNVRQLQNAIQRAKILSDDHGIHATDLPTEIFDTREFSTSGCNEVDLATHTRGFILERYHRHNLNKTETARSLGISRRTLYRRLKKYDALRNSTSSC